MFTSRVQDNALPGIEIEGIDAESLADGTVREELRRLWIEHGLLIFRNVEGPELQLAISRIFGTLQPHPLIALRDEIHPELANIRYDPDSGDINMVEGRELGGYLLWHKDLIYVDRINRGGILRPKRLPASGGDTGFLDQIEAYDRLPCDLKDRIDDLWVIYESKFLPAQSKFGKPPSFRTVRTGRDLAATQDQVRQAPRVLHPMVFIQKETGRKVLNISPWFSAGILGQEDEQGDQLLRDIVSHLLMAPKYYHQWHADDMVLWDNWRMLHCARGVAPDASRWMQRTTIEGDYMLGRTEHPDDIIDDRLRLNI